MKITQALLDDLTEKAKASPRLRMNLNLHNSEADGSQRMLNALESGTKVPIYWHPTKMRRLCHMRWMRYWKWQKSDKSGA